MNEHDSERLAGLLVADGLVPATSFDDADVIVLNTCCIRENADNRLYGHLGDLKALRERRPGLQIAVGGCLAQLDRERIVERAGHVDVVFGTHNLAAAPALLRRAATEGTDRRGPRRARTRPPPPTRRPRSPRCATCPWAAWMTIQTGCDNSCAFCIVPVGPRTRGEPPDGRARRRGARRSPQRGVVELTVLGQNVNSYGRDLTRRRPLFAELLRALGERRGDRADPVHEPAPEGPARRDDRGDGRDARGLRAAAPAAAVRQRPRAHRDAARLPRRALPRAARRGPRGDRRPRGHDRPHRRASPARPTRTSTRRSPSWPTAEFDSAYTFVFSPRPGTRAAQDPASFVPDDVVRERFARLVAVVERSALRRNEARESAAPRRCSSRARASKDPATLTARTRQGKPVHFAAGADGGRAGVVRRGSRSPTARRTTCSASCARSPRVPDTARGSRSPLDERGRGPRRADRVGQVTRRARGGARARRRRDRLARRDGRLPRHGPRHGEADAPRRARGPLPPRRRARARPRSSRCGGSRRSATRRSRRSRARGRTALLVGGSGLYPARSSTGSTIPPTDPAVRARARRRGAPRRARGASTPSSPPRTRSPRPASTRATSAGSCARSRCCA